MSNAGVRFGAEIRKLAGSVDKARTARYPCPKCGKKSVKRRGNAKWECHACGSLFAGGAYSLSTATGDVARKTIADYSRK